MEAASPVAFSRLRVPLSFNPPKVLEEVPDEDYGLKSRNDELEEENDDLSFYGLDDVLAELEAADADEKINDAQSNNQNSFTQESKVIRETNEEKQEEENL